MAPDVFRLFHAIGVRLRNGYGSTEFGMIAIHQGEAFDLETVGGLMPVDPYFGGPVELKLSKEGELLLRGGSGFLGYLDDPAKTAEKWADGWFRTGDHCVLKDNGQLVFLERLEDMRTLAAGHRYPPQFIETRLRFSSFIKDAMTVGDERHGRVAALVAIDGEVVTRWAEERGMTFSTYADLSQRPEVCALVEAEVVRVNRLLPPGSQVYRFANLPKPLDPDEGELTRTRKLRRVVIEEKFATLIEALYGRGDVVPLTIAIRYQDGGRGELKARVQLNTVAGSSSRAINTAAENLTIATERKTA
jgi:long-chain acyl-CoA synthetase